MADGVRVVANERMLDTDLGHSPLLVDQPTGQPGPAATSQHLSQGDVTQICVQLADRVGRTRQAIADRRPRDPRVDLPSPVFGGEVGLGQ